MRCCLAASSIREYREPEESLRNTAWADLRRQVTLASGRIEVILPSISYAAIGRPSRVERTALLRCGRGGGSSPFAVHPRPHRRVCAPVARPMVQAPASPERRGPQGPEHRRRERRSRTAKGELPPPRPPSTKRERSGAIAADPVPCAGTPGHPKFLNCEGGQVRPPQKQNGRPCFRGTGRDGPTGAGWCYSAPPAAFVFGMTAKLTFW